ncbi:hypothetical protein D3C73_1162720 [compost metagenome]
MTFLVNVYERNLFFHRDIHIPSASDHDIRFALSNRLDYPRGAAFRDILRIIADPVGNALNILVGALVRSDADHLNAKLFQSGDDRPALDASGIEHCLLAFQNFAVWPKVMRQPVLFAFGEAVDPALHFPVVQQICHLAQRIGRLLRSVE